MFVILFPSSSSSPPYSCTSTSTSGAPEHRSSVLLLCFVLCPVRFVLCAKCSLQQFPVWCFVLGAMCSNPLMVLLHAHLHIFPSNVWRLQQLNVKYFRLILRARQQIFWLHRVANERVSKWFHKLQSSCLGSACLWIWPSNPPAPNFCPKKMSFTAPDSYKHGL